MAVLKIWENPQIIYHYVQYCAILYFHSDIYIFFKDFLIPQKSLFQSSSLPMMTKKTHKLRTTHTHTRTHTHTQTEAHFLCILRENQASARLKEAKWEYPGSSHLTR